MPTWFSKKPSDVPTVEAGPGVSARPEVPLYAATTVQTPSPQDAEAARQRLAEYNSFASLNHRLKDCCYDFQISEEEFSTCLKFYQAQEAKRQATASSPGYSLVDIAVIREAKRRVREEQKLPPTAHVADQDIGIMTGKLRQEASWRNLCSQAEKKIRRRDNLSPDKPVKWSDIEELAKQLLEEQSKKRLAFQTPTPSFPSKAP
jgi:hypothetical protein